MLTIRQILVCAGKAVTETIRHDGIEHAGYLAFLGLLGLFPFLVLLVTLGGMVGESRVGAEFAGILHHLPPEMVRALKPRIDEIVSGPPLGLKTLALIGAIWTASSGVEGLRTILNRAHHVEAPPPYLFRRFMSILQFLAITVITLSAMFLLIPVPLIVARVEEALSLGAFFEPVWTYTRLGISALLLFATVSTLYYVLPNINQRWRAVAPGAVVVAALWMLLGSLFAAYLSNFQQVSLIYGGLEGIIVALLFFDAAGLIFIFGAEFNYLLERAEGNTP